MKQAISILILAMALAVTASAQATVAKHLENARRIAKTRDFSGAAAEVGHAIAIEPANIKLYLTRAGYRLTAREFAGVREDVAKAWQLDPNREETLHLGSHLLDTGIEEDCRTMLAMADAFLEKNPASDRAFEARFRAKTCLGDTAGAFNDISMAAELNPDHPTHWMNVGRMISRFGNTVEAIRLQTALVDKKSAELSASDAKHRLRLSHELRVLLMGRSQLYQRNKEYELGLADVNRVVELFPTSGSLLYRARFYSHSDRHDEAIAEIDKILRMADKGQEKPEQKVSWKYNLYLERASILTAAGKIAGAIADIEAAIRLLPANRQQLETRIANLRKQAEGSQR